MADTLRNFSMNGLGVNLKNSEMMTILVHVNGHSLASEYNWFWIRNHSESKAVSKWFDVLTKFLIKLIHVGKVLETRDIDIIK